MPRQEELVPWLATQAATHEPYPRKNLYFAGNGRDEVYDFCIWQAHIAGHATLDGDNARSSSALINDVLTRLYLNTMLDPNKIEAFTLWRTAEYLVDNRTVRPSAPQPQLLIAENHILKRKIYVPSAGRYFDLEDPRQAKELMHLYAAARRQRAERAAREREREPL